jgi:hypothetical protein
MASTDNAYASCLRELGLILREMALEGKRRRDASGSDDRAYEMGRLMALHEVVALMQEQAEAFHIPLDDLGLSDLAPERDLL